MTKPIQHQCFNKAKRAFKRIGLPVHEQSGLTAPPDSRFTGAWLEPSGVHFVRKHCTIGHLVHEAAHYALIQPEKRPQLQPGCLSDLGIVTCGEDPACEAWSGAFARFAGFSMEHLFTDIEDYSYSVSEAVDEWQLSMKISLELLQKKHVGVLLLRYLGMTSDNYPEMKCWYPDGQAITRHFEIVEECGSLMKFAC